MKVNKVLLLILLLSFLLRVWGINEPIWVDEAISLNYAQQPLMKGIELTLNDVHLPIHNIMLHFWPGDSLISARMLSVLFGVLTVFMIYLIAKELFDEKTGLIASFLYSLSTLAIYYSQEARVYSLLTFAVCLSMYFLIKENKSGYFISTL
ncbi:glycosyltransferase family 39 protein, partial [Candidatus Woesearchaeota archaeon]|nr:glycosyltransferase family 39 protein [Candidatus Woesearchaeota archaeon]